MNYVFYYIESNIICIIIFGLILLRDIRAVDRQERQRLFDQALMFHIAYFINDCLWALIDGAYLPKTPVSMGISNVMVFVLAEFIGYYWFLYSELLQGSTFVNSRSKRLSMALPLIVAGIVVVIEFLMGRGYWIDNAGNPHDYIVYFSLLVVPIGYIVASSVRALVRALRERNESERRQLMLVATYPIVLVVSAGLQMMFLRVAILCFGTTIAMLNVYLHSLDSLVSLDPLTQLNNRNQLNRYLLQHAEDVSPAAGEHLFVLMLDLDKFKPINDKYGHLEGDNALVMCADVLRAACSEPTSLGRPFIARYGGDEFIVVAQARNPQEMDGLAARICAQFDEANAMSDKPWTLQASLGYAEVTGGVDGVRAAISAADKLLYQQKQSHHQAR